MSRPECERCGSYDLLNGNECQDCGDLISIDEALARVEDANKHYDSLPHIKLKPISIDQAREKKKGEWLTKAVDFAKKAIKW